jgi:hypothetical protein
LRFNSVSKNTDSVSSGHWQEKIAFMPQTFLNQNNLLPVSENSTTQADTEVTQVASELANVFSSVVEMDVVTTECVLTTAKGIFEVLHSDLE